MSTEWHKLITREGVDLLSISGLDVVFYDCIRQYDKKTREPFFTILENKILTHYLCVDELAVGRAIYKSYFRTPGKVKKYYAAGNEFFKSVRKSVQKWKAVSQQKTNWELAAWRNCRQQFEHINYHFSIWPWWGIESWQIDFEAMLKKLITRRGLRDREEQIVASVYKPWKKTAIIKLQAEYQRGAPVARLVKRYQFLRSWSLVWYRPISGKWIHDIGRKKIKDITFPLLSLPGVCRLLKPNQVEQKFLSLAPYISFFKDWRDDVRRQYVYEWSFLFDHLAKKFAIERNDLGYVSLDELETCLRTNRWPHKVVQFRKNHPCVITTADGSLKMRIIDHKVDPYLHIRQQVEHQQKSQLVITGIIAQRGKAIGPVRLLKTYHDIKKVKAGDILVANTTHPNYLPAMQKAAAFITNEGGMISHAAIVARELKKPCVVGTKNATEVLKDGDRVEVDANNGIIKKLV